MTTVERTTSIAAPPTIVWAVLADFAGISDWAPNVDHSCLLTAQQTGAGTQRRIQTGRTTLVETVREWAPPDPEQPPVSQAGVSRSGVSRSGVLSYAIAGLPPVIRSVVNTWRLDAAGEATSVTLTSDVDAGPRPPQQMIARIVARKLAAASEQMLDGLAAHIREQERMP